MGEMESHNKLLYKTSKNKLKKLKTSKNNYGNWYLHTKNDFLLGIHFISQYCRRRTLCVSVHMCICMCIYKIVYVLIINFLR